MTASLPAASRKIGELSALSALAEGGRLPPETVDSARSMAEWILLPLLRRREAAPLLELSEGGEGSWALAEDTPWIVRFHDGVPYGEAPDLTPAEGSPEAPADEESLPVYWEALDFRYPHRAACTTPTKLTATQLKGREKDREIAEDTVQPYVRKAFSAPRFLSGRRPLDPAERGTAVHLVMQHLPLDGSAEETVEDLVRRRLLTPEQAEAVDLGAIRQFLRSRLAEDLRRADRVEREVRFSLLAPAGDYYAGMAREDQVLLQGVVDLYAVKDGTLTVVDFKTDRVTEETLPEKLAYYRPQLEAYSGALEKILQMPVVRRVLYFFHTGQEIDV